MRIKLKDGSHYVTKTVVGTIAQREDGKPLVAIVSTEDVDSYGDVIMQGPNERGKGWLLDRFNKAPRIYWMHDPFTPNLAAARAWVENKRLMLEVGFDMADPFASGLDRKYRAGYLSEWSVGFRSIVEGPRAEGERGLFFYEQELRETSAVNRGANPSTDTISKCAGLEISEIDDQESSELRLLKAELQDYRDEIDGRLREIESAIMRGAREASEARAEKEQEAIAVLNQRTDALFKTIAAIQE